jgi:hypothetical protein
MTEGNFVDYVKYLFHPVKEERIYALHREFIERGPDGVMEVVEDMYI